MYILVTGASGRIGRAFVGAADRLQFQILRGDLHDGDPSSSHPFMRLDVTDPATCLTACADVAGVLHLAGDPSPTADFRTSVLPVNIVGTHNMIEAAVASGVARFVFASSAQAVEGYPADYQIREEDPPRPANGYGVGKAAGEALCAAASLHGHTAFVSVRIGNYSDERPGPNATLRDRMAWLSPADAVELLSLALTTPLDGHQVVHAVSDNTTKRLAIEQTRRLLGYAPVANAFT